MSKIQPEDRHQQEMFSSLDDQIAKESFVRLLDLFIDKIYVEKTEKEDKIKDGRPEYPRKSLLKLYVYGYINRIKSSRRLERECKVNLEVMWLMGRLEPDHWTISFFRKDNQEQIKQAVKRLIDFLKETGYIEGKTIVIDGTKIKANASGSGNMDLDEIKERIEGAEQKIAYYLETIEKEDDQNEQIEKLKKEKKELEEQLEKLKAENKRVYIKTDPDANIMMKKPRYNVQASYDAKNKLIVATDVVTEVNDFKQLKNMNDKSTEMLGAKPEKIIADAGYYCPEIVQEIEEQEQIDTYVAVMPESKKGKFTYDSDKDEYTCMDGRILKYRRNQKDRNGRLKRIYESTDCSNCKLKELCTDAKNGRTTGRYDNQEFRDSYREKMKEPESIKMMTLRKTIAEHPFATLKLWMGYNPLLTRGKKNVHTEVRLVTLAYNLLRMYNIERFDNLVSKIMNYNWQPV